MELITKPDLDEVKKRWEAFWEGEILGQWEDKILFMGDLVPHFSGIRDLISIRSGWHRGGAA